MTSLESLLGSMLGVPALPGARCRGRSRLFDPAGEREPTETVAQRHQQALGLCSACPALEPCSEWLQTLTPARKPQGVIAGRVIQPRKPRRGTESLNESSDRRVP